MVAVKAERDGKDTPQNEEIRTISQRLKDKAKGWLRLPGPFYLGDSRIYPVFALRGLRGERSLQFLKPGGVAEYVRERESFVVEQAWLNRRDKPHIVIAHIEPHTGELEIPAGFLGLGRAKREIHIPEVTFISLTSRVKDEKGGVVRTEELARSLIFKGSEPPALLIAQRVIMRYPNGSKSEEAFSTQEQDADIEMLEFFDRYLEEPVAVRDYGSLSTK